MIIGLALGALALGALPIPILAAPAPAARWVIDGAEGRRRLDAGATLIDARRLAWTDFSEPGAPRRRRGLLDRDDARLQRRLRQLGVRNDQPVIVIGESPPRWGEAGRLVWTLRTLGHRDTAMIDGGETALRRAGGALTRPPPPPGDFTVHRVERWTITTEALSARLAGSGPPPLLVDTRTREEYRGATPYGERRGGHLRGAISLPFAQLLDRRGLLLPRPRLLARLATAGLTPDRPVVVYCTGGVRSAWLVVVLNHLGFTGARNYSGSTWAWSAGSPARFPLE